jgi:hypothetical protein
VFPHTMRGKGALSVVFHTLRGAGRHDAGWTTSGTGPSRGTRGVGGVRGSSGDPAARRARSQPAHASRAR